MVDRDFMTDPRREPDDIDSDDCPTDVGLDLPLRPKMRVESARPKPVYGVGDMEETTDVKPRAALIGHSTAALPKTVHASLEVKSGPAAGQAPFAIGMVRTAIGRGRQADLRVADGRLSRRHAVIFYTGSEFRIRDEGSANGTFLNGSNVSEYRVSDGDEIMVGNTTLVFRTTPT